MSAGQLDGMTDAVLGLTVLAWGNSLGDFIADTAMTKAGYPRMGYSACFAGPMMLRAALLAALASTGIRFTLSLKRATQRRHLSAV